MYSKKLLIRGWPGSLDAVERQYVRAHRSDSANRQAQHRAAHMQKVRSLAGNRNTRDAEATNADSGTPRTVQQAASGA